MKLPSPPNVPDNALRRYLRLLGEAVNALQAGAATPAAPTPSNPGGGSSSVVLADLPPEALAPQRHAGIIDEAARRDHLHPFPTATQVGADPAGSAAAAESAANSYTDGAITDEITRADAAYDAIGSAATAESNANTYTDNQIADEVSRADAAYDPIGAAAAALSSANGYTDSQIAGLTFPYDLHAFAPGAPAASAVVLHAVVPRAVSIADNLAGSRAHAGVAATASTDFDVLVNGVSVGTINFASAATTATFSTSGGAVALAAGDRLSIVAPGSPDATLADIAFAILGAA